MKHNHCFITASTPASQNGLALFSILVFLLILTVIGLSSMQSSRLEQMISGNLQWSNIAFQAAETGLTNTIKNSDWGCMAENSNVSSDFYDGDSKNIDYTSKSYLVGFSGLGRVSRKAWSVKKMHRANFKNTVDGMAKVETDDNSGEKLATVKLEEGVYLYAPK